MVLGFRSKLRRGASVNVNYIVNIQEIRPWPPLDSLRSIETVLLQWENGSRHSGSFLSAPQESKIVFNESFELPLTLYQDKKAHDKFQKNHLEFSLSVPRKDKAKWQPLGTALINLADYGVIEHVVTINALVNLKKSSNNSVQPELIISVEPVEKDSSNSWPNVGLSKETSPNNDVDDIEIASFTDDDASFQSSRTEGSPTFEAATSSPAQIEKEGYADDGLGQEHNRINVRPSSTDATSDSDNHANENFPFSKFYEQKMTYVEKNSDALFTRSSSSSISFLDTNEKPNAVASSAQESVSSTSHEVVANIEHRTIGNTQLSLEEKPIEEFAPEAMSAYNYRENADNSDSTNSHASQDRVLRPEDVQINDAHVGVVDFEEKKELKDSGSNDQIKEKIGQFPERKLMEESVHVHDSVKGNGFLYDDPQKKVELGEVIGRKEPDGEGSDWKTRIEMLEEELREAAATEIGLYSIVAEHASSGNKVHAPARRLSRFYSNACKAGSQAKRASAARAAISGLVLVSKSCGNDVPRLTFWLSNSIMLRAIVSQIAAEGPHSDGPERNITGAEPNESADREDVWTFITAMEKVESWLFSRIVESVWWQTFTPHMQPTVAKDIKKTFGRRKNVSNHEQGKFSTELWKKAFKDACERLCPIRAEGHECGCLSVLVRMVMEQLVNRLDVAMFNAILRESSEEMPTDPLSDPISDSKVLPILPGKSSFGAGVELKNTIGNWSRWLTDLFGLEDDSTEHSDSKPESFKAFRLLHALSDLMMLPFGMLADASSMKEVCPMFGPTIIKRVLTNFVPDEFCTNPIPQNIIDALNIDEEISDGSGDLLTSFPCTASPTKYSPPPAALLTCVGEVGSQVLKSSRLSTLKKSYNSDDELDELGSPLTSIVPDSFQDSALAKLSLMAKEKGGRNIVRYQLLQEIWKDDE
uniref:GPT1 n=1 Tax=Catalpa bungei TaxID=265496 RepID=A0A142CD30_9LAMI|nr:GPT1 [Catalpa bungei]